MKAVIKETSDFKVIVEEEVIVKVLEMIIRNCVERWMKLT